MSTPTSHTATHRSTGAAAELTQAAVDARFMARAISLAKQGWYTTHPNPRVGCVLVKEGEIIGEGYHERAGRPHAERQALADARGKHADKIAGATAYVTLEPCSHHGRTPPCSEGLIEAGVARVVVAMQDPNPLVAGEGIAQLQQAGIEVSCGVLEASASQLNPGFIKRMLEKRPLIRCKLAMSLDGRTAMSSGESKWITGPAARADVQRLRAEVSAVMTGVGTVLADNPSLNVRDEKYAAFARAPVRIILDSTLRTPVDAKLLSLPGEVVIVTTDESAASKPDLVKRFAEQGVKVLTAQGHATADGLDLTSVMQALEPLQLNEVLLECGAALSGAMLQQGLIDELVVYMAPHLMGSEARGLMQLPGFEKMSDRVALRFDDVRMIGDDLRLCATVLAKDVTPH